MDEDKYEGQRKSESRSARISTFLPSDVVDWLKKVILPLYYRLGQKQLRNTCSKMVKSFQKEQIFFDT